MLRIEALQRAYVDLPSPRKVEQPTIYTLIWTLIHIYRENEALPTRFHRRTRQMTQMYVTISDDGAQSTVNN